MPEKKIEKKEATILSVEQKQRLVKYKIKINKVLFLMKLSVLNSNGFNAFSNTANLSN